MNDAQSSDRLKSWKAIANYLGRSERTARRWEAEEGLPVHRHMHHAQASVYAYPAELDAWQRGKDTPTTDRAAARAERASIGVLPFSFVGPNAGDAYIADGFTDEVIADLAKVRSLRVISRTSSMSLKGTTEDAPSLAKRLGVSRLLEGSVQLSGSDLRISVRLIDAASDHPVWAEKYAGQVEEVFEFQELIAREVARELALHLSSEEDRKLAERSLPSWPVWQSVVQARQESLRWTRDSIDNAVRLLERAIAEAGDNAALYAALGRAYLQYRETGMDLGAEPIERAERCVAKAFEVDPNSAAGLQLRGWLRYSQGEIQLAVHDLKAALEIDWGDPDPLGVLCNCYLISGQMAEARIAIDRLLSVDPLTPLFQILPAWADVLEGNPAAAIDVYARMLAREPSSSMARLFFVWVLTINGRAEEAAEAAAGFDETSRDSLPALVSRLFAAAGSAIESDVNMTPENEQIAAANDLFPRMLAQAYALAGKVDEALHWLAIAVDRGFINYPYLSEHDVLLTGLKGDARFEKLLADVRARWQSFEA